MISNVVSHLLSKWKMIISKNEYPKIVLDKRYKDQSLREILFEDGHILIIYPLPLLPQCTCNLREQNPELESLQKFKKCIHEKQLCNKLYDQGDVESVKSLTSDENDENNENDENKENNNIECPTCLHKIAHNSKYVSCQVCKVKIHKTCWKFWQVAKKKSRKIQTVSECVQCRSILRNDNKDNEGVPL